MGAEAVPRETAGEANLSAMIATSKLAGNERGKISMSTMIFEIYDALKEAGASEEKAKAAAEAIAAYENQFAKMDTDLTVVKWMVGFNLALSVSILFKLFA